MFVNDGIESQAIPPAGSEIPDIDVRVSSSLHLAPKQESIFGRFCLTIFSFFNDVLNLKRKHHQLMLVIISFWSLSPNHKMKERKTGFRVSVYFVFNNKHRIV